MTHSSPTILYLKLPGDFQAVKHLVQPHDEILALALTREGVVEARENGVAYVTPYEVLTEEDWNALLEDARWLARFWPGALKEPALSADEARRAGAAQNTTLLLWRECTYCAMLAKKVVEAYAPAAVCLHSSFNRPHEWWQTRDVAHDLPECTMRDAAERAGIEVRSAARAAEPAATASRKSAVAQLAGAIHDATPAPLIHLYRRAKYRQRAHEYSGPPLWKQIPVSKLARPIVLGVGSYGDYFNLVPAMAALQEHGVTVVPVHLPGGRPDFARAADHSATGAAAARMQYYSVREDAEYRRLHARLTKRFSRGVIRFNASMLPELEQHPLAAAVLANPLLGFQWRLLMHERMPIDLATSELAERMVEFVRPEVVLTSSIFGTVERCINDRARELGLISIILPHGGPFSPLFDIHTNDSNADYYAATNSYRSEQLCDSLGKRAEHAPIVSPLQSVMALRLEPCETGSGALANNERRKVIFLTDSGAMNLLPIVHPGAWVDSMGAIAEFARSEANIDVILRPHPRGDSYDVYSRMAAEIPNITLERGGRLSDLVGGADIVISVSALSSAMFEALKLGKPCLFLGDGIRLIATLRLSFQRESFEPIECSATTLSARILDALGNANASESLAAAGQSVLRAFLEQEESGGRGTIVDLIERLLAGRSATATAANNLTRR